MSYWNYLTKFITEVKRVYPKIDEEELENVLAELETKVNRLIRQI